MPTAARRLVSPALTVTCIVLTIGFARPVEAASFESAFADTPDRIWPGGDYWANPLENWRIDDGRLVCTSFGADRNVHLLTRDLGTMRGSFETAVIIGVAERGEADTPGSEKTTLTLEPGAERSRDASPAIAGRGFRITARLDQVSPDGVIVAQGGEAVGYALYMQQGRLTLALRRDGELETLSAPDALRARQAEVGAVLRPDGRIALSVNGEVVARGKTPGPLAAMPADGLQVGRDLQSNVGDYNGDFAYDGGIAGVRVELLGEAPRPRGAAGFRIAAPDETLDHRAAAFSQFAQSNTEALITAGGELRLLDQTAAIPDDALDQPIRLTLTGEPRRQAYDLTLTATVAESGKRLGRLTVENVPHDHLVGNVALVQNPAAERPTRFWFQRWRLSGAKVVAHPDRAFGPIMWSMYTLSDSPGDEGYVMQLSAQMPPLSDKDSRTVALQTRQSGAWQNIETATIDPDARIALFRVANWPAEKDVAYRLVYETTRTDGETVRDTWRGTIQRNPPPDEPVSVAGLNCEQFRGFPYEPVARNVAAADPDVLVFSGDQVYEENGGYGIVRRPADKAIVSYLRKYYLHGWAFREVMRDRPTLCLTDDHDVFQANLFGAGGEKMPPGASTANTGGYIQPVRMINAVHRTQTAHHPDYDDPAPIRRGIKPYYGDMVYGGISFAVVDDRMFKSGPREVDTGSGRPDIVHEAELDPEGLDKPGLTLLGERQKAFLREWVADWRGAEMKLLLTQTPMYTALTHTSPRYERIIADLDTNGWPQTPRDEALRIIRKGFPFHLAGDQHLTTMVHNGVAEQRDSMWTFTAPAVSVGWPRWFMPDQVGISHSDRPAHGLPNTGAYIDGFGNKMYVRAVGNPTKQSGTTRYAQSHHKASGFGLVTMNKEERTITADAYRFFAEIDSPVPAEQFPGWPVTVNQRSNYGRETAGTLGTYRLDGVAEPVVKVYHEPGGELVYAIRAQKPSFEAFVFEPGRYTVKIGDPANDQWETHRNQMIE